MARRRQTLFEDLITLASKLPWWLAVALAVAAYFWMHGVATSEVVAAQPGGMGAVVGQSLIHGLASVGQYALPLVLGVEAPAKLFRDPLSITTIGAPYCPICQGRMVKRKARRGENAGKAFWGCTHYPECKGTRPL